MFKDKVRIKLVAGDGGNGHVSYFLGRKPYGGIGGDGASVYLEGSVNAYDLRAIQPDSTIKAENGENGGDNNSTGRFGEDLILKVPLTTHVKDGQGNIIVSLSKHGQRELLAKGGRGGLGNFFYRTKGLDKLDRADPGKPGGELNVFLDLELQSDVLLIGFPNAGKSSLLNEITRATSKVAPYAFTTLYPQLGMLDGIVIMDLPGLIEGTHEGKGLGTNFVKHTKSAKVLAHVLSLESGDLLNQYKTMRTELEAISPNLFAKPEVIVLTKSDLVTPENIKTAMKSLKKLKRPILVCSVFDFDSLEQLKQDLIKFLNSN